MKALSLKQPWAWAVVNGYMHLENRPRRTNYRGPLLIHASRVMDPDGFQFLWKLGLHRKLPSDLATGAIVGSVELIDCRIEPDNQWAFKGHWHWILAKPHEYRNPIECRGSLGIFDPDVSAGTIGGAERYAIHHRFRRD